MVWPALCRDPAVELVIISHEKRGSCDPLQAINVFDFAQDLCKGSYPCRHRVIAVPSTDSTLRLIS